MTDEDKPLAIFPNGELVRLGQRVLDKALDRDLAIAAAQQAHHEAQQLRAQLDQQATQKPKLSAREVLRLFDERRKTEPRLELKQFCDELGANYKSIRVAKTRLAKEKRKRKKK